MTCSDFLKELTDYLDESMDAQTRAELEDHLQWCHNCYVVCNTTKMTIEIYRDSHLYELPDDLRGRLRSAIMTNARATTARAHRNDPAGQASYFPIDCFRLAWQALRFYSPRTPPAAKDLIWPTSGGCTLAIFGYNAVVRSLRRTNGGWQ